jgi:hypothetical protein
MGCGQEFVIVLIGAGLSDVGHLCEWAVGEKITHQGDLAHEALHAVTVVELDCRGIAGVDGEGQTGQISLSNPIEGEFHEVLADSQAADGGG